MTLLPNGSYQTPSGSILQISGQCGGIVEVNFDWLEEGGCIDCQVQPYPEEFGLNDWRLVWSCEVCGGGNAKLREFEVVRVYKNPAGSQPGGARAFPNERASASKVPD